MSQLYLTLPSDSSFAYHPENTVANFTTRLHHAIDLGNEEWEVGLSEIIYPNLWRNVRSYEEGTIQFTEKDSKLVHTHIIKPGFYETVKALCTTATTISKGNASFRWLAHEYKVLLLLHEDGTVRLSSLLSEMFGLPKIVNGLKGSQYEGNIVWDTKRGLEALYVYCSVAEHQMVGDVSAPLLRILPIRGKHGQTISRTFENVHYVPARGGQIQSIEMDIRNNVGGPIPFEGGCVVVVLHLRKATQSHFIA